MTHSSFGHKREGMSADTSREILRRVDSFDHALFAVGIEILPYELVGVITEFDGTVRGFRRWTVSRMDVETVVERIAELVRYLAGSSLGLDVPNPRICIGVQLGAPVEVSSGTVLYYSNPLEHYPGSSPPYEWKNVKLVDLIEAATGCVTVLENDAAAYAVYEQKFGLGRRTDSFVLLLVRDGVGSAVVIDNQLLLLPLETGHIPVWPSEQECYCGKLGCVESVSGRRGIRTAVAKLAGLRSVDPFEQAVEIANGSGEFADAALRAFRQAGESIARAIGTLLTLFGPRHIVIYGPEELIGSGQGSAAADRFMEGVRRFLDHTFSVVVRQCELVPESLSPETPERGARGAALTALNRHFFVSLEPSLEHR
jgi:predicted NBD/HSP70 family sugar kinase